MSGLPDDRCAALGLDFTVGLDRGLVGGLERGLADRACANVEHDASLIGVCGYGLERSPSLTHVRPVGKSNRE